MPIFHHVGPGLELKLSGWVAGTFIHWAILPGPYHCGFSFSAEKLLVSILFYVYFRQWLLSADFNLLIILIIQTLFSIIKYIQFDNFSSYLASVTLVNFEKPAVAVKARNLVLSTYAPYPTVAVAHPGTHIERCTLSEEKFRNVS